MRRVALLTHGFSTGGGVPTIARWLQRSLESYGNYLVDVHDLATSSRDTWSRRLAAPKSWIRSTLKSDPSCDPAAQHWGANAVELEFMRYRPRSELTRCIRDYDLIQMVTGSPAWAAVTKGCPVPVVLQVATMAAWERQSQLAVCGGSLRAWRRAMTSVTTRIELDAIRHTDAVIVENAVMLEHVRSLGHKRVIQAPPGVDTREFSPSDDGWQANGHVLSVCRLGDRRKGLDRLVRAYARIVRTDQSAPPLVLAGRGGAPESVVGLVRELGLASRVSIRSDVSAVELLKLYRGASVFLQTSHEEGLGMSVLEAMACALPVVATETAGSSEVVSHGVTGWLVPQAPDADIAGGISDHTLRLLRGSGATFGRNGRRRCVAEFSTKAAAQRFVDVYDDLLQPRRAEVSDGVL